MRAELVKYKDKRLTFTGIVTCFSTKCGNQRTVLLKDVRDETGNRVSDHLWMDMAHSFEGIEQGTAVAFNAKVTGYIKGYRGQRDDGYCKPIQIDYALSRPTKVRKLGY